MKTVQISYLFCLLFVQFTVFGQTDKEVWEVNSDFEELVVSGPYEVMVFDRPQDGEIEIEGAKEDLESLLIEVKDSKLVIKRKSSLKVFDKPVGKIKINLNAHDLSSLTLSGSGSISTNGFQEVEKLKLNLSGSGELNAKLKTTKVITSLSGPGTVNLTGTSDHLDIKKSGSGNINAYDLKTKSAKIVGSGSGNVYLTTDDKLKVASIGSGNVFFKGYPEVELQSAGSGKVVEAN